MLPMLVDSVVAAAADARDAWHLAVPMRKTFCEVLYVVTCRLMLIILNARLYRRFG